MRITTWMTALYAVLLPIGCGKQANDGELPETEESSDWAPEASCSDGIDDNDDELTDCEDPLCALSDECFFADPTNGEVGADACTDGQDNDGDGGIDCGDPSCLDSSPCGELHCAGGRCCTDGADNDGDGAVDCDDRECARSAACSLESDCDDGSDNDLDTWADCDDPDCTGAAGPNGEVCLAPVSANICPDADCEVATECPRHSGGQPDCDHPNCRFEAACSCSNEHPETACGVECPEGTPIFDSATNSIVCHTGPVE